VCGCEFPVPGSPFPVGSRNPEPVTVNQKP
jgi:hypothetical protein